MEYYFEAVAEDQAGTKWQALFQRLWPAYKHWFFRDGNKQRASYLTSFNKLRQHMPELVPTYERLLNLAGDSDSGARFLALYCPPAYLTACSQAVWPGQPPLLIRNYDYNMQLFEGLVLKTAWNGRQVIATSDCLWGVLDGINDAGLAVSLTFGGRQVVGAGFGVPLLLRYVLEFCDTAQEAAQMLQRIPSHMAYNVTVLDNQGQFLTIFIAPDREAIVRRLAVTTNHQQQVEWHQHAQATATLERERFLKFRLRECDSDPDKLLRAFLRSPVYSTAFERGFGTLYTAVLRPQSGAVEYRWPNATWQQSFASFEEGIKLVRLPSTSA